MGVELVTQNDEAGIGSRLDQSLDVPNKVRFGSGVGNRWAEEFSRCQVKIASQDLRAMPDVVELSTLHLASPGWQCCPIPLKRLDAWFFVNTHYTNPLRFVAAFSSGMQCADQLDLQSKVMPVLNVWMFPVPTSMRLEGRVLLKNARCGPERSS